MEKTKHKRILVIGNMPPPLGGVSIYVRRRVKQLKDQGHLVDQFPSKPTLKELLVAVFLIFPNHYDVIEVNSFRAIWMVLPRLIFWRAEVLLIDHNGSFQFQFWSKTKLIIYAAAFRFVDKIDLVRETMIENYNQISWHRSLIFGCRASFISPSDEEGRVAIEGWPYQLQVFVEGYSNLIVTCAYLLDFKKNDYRFIECINAFSVVHKAFPDARMVMVASLCDRDYYDKMHELIKLYGLQDSIYFHVGQIEIWPLFKMAKIFLRITTTDGDSVSVKEALSLGAKVIATDVVARPGGVNLVGLAQSDELVSAIKSILLH